MKLGIAGLLQTGKSTIFTALTGARGELDSAAGRSDTRVATVTVMDERVDFLSRMFKPKKTTRAKIEYFLPSEISGASASKSESGVWNQLRTADALFHVVRNFVNMGGEMPASEDDFRRVEDEMIVSDLLVAEKRIERLDADRKRGRTPEGDEEDLLKRCIEVLEKGRPLRLRPELAKAPLLRGFTFLSAKPLLIICNNDDEDEAPPEWKKMPEGVEMLVVRGRLEMDISSMEQEEAEEFKEAYNIRETVLDRVISSSFRLLNRISFFTVGSDEVKAWPIAEGTAALDAAGEIHSDIKKGFIRAEVVSFDDLRQCGGMQEAKKAGLARLEGKEYIVKDGDIINFRFNV